MALRWRDIDAFGHVNHATYLTLLEEGRDAWLEDRLALPAPYEYVVVHVALDYRGELALEDSPVHVTIELANIGTKSLQMSERLLSREGDLVAEATVSIVLWDRRGRQPRPLTERERQCCELELADAVRPAPEAAG